MKPKGSWYFDGYQSVTETTPDGKQKKKLVYTGEWYGFQGGAARLKQMKLRCLLLSLAGIACNLLAQFFPSTGGMVHWMALPSLFSLVPMIFLIVGLVNFLPSREKWEIRVYYAGYRRLGRSAGVMLLLQAVWLVMELVFVAMNLSLFLSELPYLLLVLAGAAALGAEVLLIHRVPAVVVQGPKIE